MNAPRPPYRGKPRSFQRGQGFNSAPAASAPKAPKLQTIGDPCLWKTMQKITDSETGTVAMTRVMTVPGGVILNTRTRTPQGPSEALIFIPHVGIGASGNGITLVSTMKT